MKQQLRIWKFTGRSGEENLQWMHYQLELIMKKLTFRQGHLRQAVELHNVTCLHEIRLLRFQMSDRRGTYQRHSPWRGPGEFHMRGVSLWEYLESARILSSRGDHT